MERIWGNWEEMEREWGNGARDRMRERKNFISVFPSLCCKTLKFLTFCHKTLKYVTFCREMLKYGTFCRECRKNLNIRAMRKWFWIKSGCEEAPQVVSAWPRQSYINANFIHIKMHHLISLLAMFWPNVRCHPCVRGLSWWTPSLASPDQLVAVNALHQSKISLHNLKMIPPKTRRPAPARHVDNKRKMWGISVIDKFFLYKIVCSINSGLRSFRLIKKQSCIHLAITACILEVNQFPLLFQKL